MFHFLDDHNLTDVERNDIDRILREKKDKAKCEFPGEASSAPCERKCNIEGSVDDASMDACAPTSYSDHHHQLINTNYVQNSVSLQQQFNSSSAASFIHVPVASSQNNIYQMSGQQGAQLYSPVTSNHINAMIATGPGGVPYIPLQYFLTAANYGSIPGRSPQFYFSAGQMPPRYPVIYAPTNLNFQTHEISSTHYSNAAVPTTTMDVGGEATSPTIDSERLASAAEQQESESRCSADSTEVFLNADVLSPNLVAAANDVDSNVNMCNVVNSPPTTTMSASFEDGVQRSTNDVNNINDKSTDVPTSTGVSSKNPNPTDDDFCFKQPNSNDIAHSDDTLESAVDAAGPDDSTTTVDDPIQSMNLLDVNSTVSPNENITRQTGEENSFINENIADGESISTTNNQPINDSNAFSATATDESNATATTKSWASLFKNTRAANNAIVINKFVDDETLGGDLSSPTAPNASNASVMSAQFNVTVTSVERDPLAPKLKKSLKSYSLTHRGPIFQLRGLNNCGNWCYVNASLQALMACPPFVHLLRQLKFMDMRTPSSTPMLDALVRFVGEFPDKYTRKSSSQELDKGTAFEPVYIHSLLSTLRDDTSFKGRQEDAEEFLGVVLNHLHEEMAACLTFGNEAVQNGNADVRNVSSAISSDEWQQVGSGKKSAVTRTSKLSPSPIADIFSGVLRNSFQQQGLKETATLESFFTLQLSIQSNDIVSVPSALAHLGKEIMKNASISSKNSKVEGDIMRRTTFQELPIVLILHLKYFVYSDDSVKKLIKPIQYNVDLQIDRNLAPPMPTSGKVDKFSRSYKLFAVVFHHGEKTEGGHYTADIFHGGHWVNMDDIKVELVDEQHVTTFQPPRVPYLLFYRRCDMFSENRGGGGY